MASNGFVLAATVILLFALGYFFLASPAFLFVKLDIPPVTQLLRGMFNVQFQMLTVAGSIGTLAFVLAGRPAFAIGTGLIAFLAVWGRPRFLGLMDAQLQARDSGDARAVARLRRLHWGGMFANAILLAAVVCSLPFVSTSS